MQHFVQSVGIFWLRTDLKETFGVVIGNGIGKCFNLQK